MTTRTGSIIRRMLISRFRKRSVCAAQLILATLLAGCGSGTSESPEGAPAPAESPEVSPGAETPAEAQQARAVISERLPYMEFEDHLVYGHFVFPSDMVEPLPAVVLVHEWWGLDDNVKTVADELAAEGYIVFAVDLFSGETTESPAKARTLAAKVIEDPASAIANVRAAYDMVSDTAGAPRVGIIGWGLGGGLSLDAAATFGDDIDAVVNYYGQVDVDEDALLPITAPLLGHYGAEDKRVSGETLKAFEESLTRLRKNYEIKTYPAVGSAFTNPTSNNFNREATNSAWQETLEFLDLHLSVDAVDDVS